MILTNDVSKTPK